MEEKVLVKYLGVDCVAEIKGIGKKILNKGDATFVLKSVYESELKNDWRFELIKEKETKINKIEEAKI